MQDHPQHIQRDNPPPPHRSPQRRRSVRGRRWPQHRRSVRGHRPYHPAGLPCRPYHLADHPSVAGRPEDRPSACLPSAAARLSSAAARLPSEAARLPSEADLPSEAGHPADHPHLLRTTCRQRQQRLPLHFRAAAKTTPPDALLLLGWPVRSPRPSGPRPIVVQRTGRQVDRCAAASRHPNIRRPHLQFVDMDLWVYS